MSFKIGDKVLCIKNEYLEDFLSINKIYEVIESEEKITYIKDDKERKVGFLPNRFKLFKSKNELENLVEECNKRIEFIKILEEKYSDKIEIKTFTSNWGSLKTGAFIQITFRIKPENVFEQFFTSTGHFVHTKDGYLHIGCFME